MKNFKSIYSISILLFLAQHVSAQNLGELNLSSTYEAKSVRDIMNKGNRYLSLNGRWGKSRNVLRESSLWSMSGQFGYFLTKRLAAGVQISYGQDRLKWKDSGIVLPASAPKDRRISTLDPELFLRYYFFSYKLKPFLQASSGANFQWGDQSTIQGEVNNISSVGFNAGGAIGLGYLVSKKVTIEALYTRKLTEAKYIDANSNVRIRLGVSVFLN